MADVANHDWPQIYILTILNLGESDVNDNIKGEIRLLFFLTAV